GSVSRRTGSVSSAWNSRTRSYVIGWRWRKRRGRTDMASTWAGTPDNQALTQAAAITAVSLGEPVWRTSQPASWNQPGRALPWREIIDHIRTLPGAPDGRDPNDPPPAEDPIMGRCPAKADVITWRQIVVQPTVPVPGIAVVRG